MLAIVLGHRELGRIEIAYPDDVAVTHNNVQTIYAVGVVANGRQLTRAHRGVGQSKRS